MGDRMSQKINSYVTGVQHIGIPTNNIADTIAFYQEIGFEVMMETVNEAAGEKVAFLQNKNLVIETYETGMATLTVGAIDHISIDVTDVDAVFKMIGTRFRSLDQEVQTLPFWEKGVKFFTIVGPNQEKIEFCERIK